MSARRRSPRPLLYSLERLRDDLAPQTLLGDVQRAWRDAVGALVAAEAEPTSERAGVLTVSCSAAVWAQELDLMGPDIVDRLNGRIGASRIRRIRCVTASRYERR